MKKIIIIFLVIATVLVLFPKFINESYDIVTINDVEQNKELILEYLENKTDDLATPNSDNGRMSASFVLLGVDKNEIYVDVLKIEYLEENGRLLDETGNTVIVLMVLYTSKINNKLNIINHNAPRDGIYYGEDLGKLFPNDINFPRNENNKILFPESKKRALEKII